MMIRTAGLVGVLIAVLAAPAGANPSQPALLRGLGIDQRLNEQVPLDLVFRDEAGRSVRLGDYFGRKPVILVLAYYRCPMLCTLVLNGLVNSLADLPLRVGDQFNVVTVSFDPRETPALAAAKKAMYLRRYPRRGTEAGWHFLTGAEPSIARLAQAVGFHYRYDPKHDQFVHASGIMVLTPQGKLARYFYGIEYPPRDLRLGLVEASANQIGSPVDQVLLFCYHYDPATGKYGLVAFNLVRLGSLLSVLALGGFIVVLRRRERVRAQATGGGTG